MANKEQVEILRQGAKTWNLWRNKHADVKIDLNLASLADTDFRFTNLKNADLSGADLSRADLSGADLSDADLYRANLSNAKIQTADLSRADLRDADLSNTYLSATQLHNANLIGVQLIGADLRDADLSGADLSSANLNKANLSSADLMMSFLSNAILSETNLSNTFIGRTIFGELDIRNCIGLETIKHQLPSHLSTSTLEKSQGQIPVEFLRGCGLSDWEIESVKLYNPELSNQEISELQYKIYDLRATRPIQVSPLFISYSHNDSAFVDELGIKLTEMGIRYWRDIHDMKSGRMEKQVDRALRLNPTVLVVLSEHSTQSDWVEHEVESARELEKELDRDCLCPVALDESWKSTDWDKRLMHQIKKYNILDFSKWQDTFTFDKTFKKLVDGLELFYK